MKSLANLKNELADVKCLREDMSVIKKSVSELI